MTDSQIALTIAIASDELLVAIVDGTAKRDAFLRYYAKAELARRAA